MVRRLARPWYAGVMKTLVPMLLLSFAAWGDAPKTAKTFVDKGSTYVRSERPLVVGDELTMATDATGATVAGHAIVMEVNGALVRVSLDEEADKKKAKFVRITNPWPAPPPAPAPAPAAPAVAAPAPAPAAPAAARAEPPPAPEKVLPLPPPPPTGGPVLQGRLESNPFRVEAHNDSRELWTDCEFKFSDGRWHKVGNIRPMSDESTVFLKFSSPPDPPFDSVVVKCLEGQSTFKFSEPAAAHQLKGFAEKDGSRVMVTNSGETPWTQCDVRKPDGSHYVMGTLKPHDRDSARGGAFVKEPDGTPKTLTLTCREGQLVQQVR